MNYLFGPLGPVLNIIDIVYDTYEHIDEFKKNMDNQNELGSIEDVVNKIIELQK